MGVRKFGGEFYNGMRHGICYEFFKGQILFKGSFFSDLKHGYALIVDEDEVLKAMKGETGEYIESENEDEEMGGVELYPQFCCFKNDKLVKMFFD